MHGFAKRGLALAATTSGLVLGTAGIAAADATASGEASHSGGIVSGNVANAAVAVPVNACGNQAGLIVVKAQDKPSTCTIGTNGGAPGASATGAAEHSGGILSGNVVGAAVAVPVNVCGNQVEAIAFKDTLEGQHCSIG